MLFGSAFLGLGFSWSYLCGGFISKGTHKNKTHLKGGALSLLEQM